MSNLKLSRRAFLKAAGAAGAVISTTSAVLTEEIHTYEDEFFEGPDTSPLIPLKPEDVRIAGDMAPALQSKIHCNLVLCMDDSISMTTGANNFKLQIEGTAAALESQSVISIIEHYGGIGVCCVFFSRTAIQSVPWAFLGKAVDAQKYAQMIRASLQLYRGENTRIHSGLYISSQLLQYSPFKSQNATVDISGDGFNSGGQEFLVKNQTRLLAKERFARVNAIAMCDKIQDLDAYFKEYVVTDQKIFNETGMATGKTWTVLRMEDFENVMTQKLINDIVLIDPGMTIPRVVHGLG